MNGRNSNFPTDIDLDLRTIPPWIGEESDTPVMPPSQPTSSSWVHQLTASGNPGAPPWTQWTTTAADLARQTFPPIRFLVPQLIPAEGLTLLAAKPKAGKSWLALDLALATACGHTALGHLIDPGDVLYCALEDSARRLQRRIDKLLEADVHWPARLHLATHWRQIDEGGIDDLRQWCAAVTHPRLIIIDVLERISTPQGAWRIHLSE